MVLNSPHLARTCLESSAHHDSISSSSVLLRTLLRSTKWRIVGLPCGQFQGDLRDARCTRICTRLNVATFSSVIKTCFLCQKGNMWLLSFAQMYIRWFTCDYFLNTFCISVLPNESPIITDDLQAREASIARTLGGQTESALSDR